MRLFLSISVLLLASCSTTQPIKTSTMQKLAVVKIVPAIKPIRKITDYFEFIAQKSYPVFYDIYENKALMASATTDNTSIEINTNTQRTLLLVDGEVALDTPSTTGSEAKKDVNDGEVVDKATPKGTFKIVQKVTEKRSTLYGDFFYNGKKVYTGDVRKYKEPYDEFVGVGMPYWMRFNDAIGMHFSEAVTRYPGSNGCVRLTMGSVKKIFSVVKIGTQIDVVNDINPEDFKPKASRL